ncbi:MAG: AAA family ATPase [Cyanobacteriota bacterium]|nr:AAA family ATPase [Cyanobacteriota bacterium]
MSDLFEHHGDSLLAGMAPLADRLRPRSLDDFAGQEAILGPGRLLRRAIAADRVGNLILHGPPGVGKTTLARIIANSTRAHFSSLNAVLAGVKDLRAEVDAARERLQRHGLRSTLFIDEVHRFNSAQQDALLPWVENGTVNLIGATTENPFFEVNKALVSRSRLFRLQPLEPKHLHQLLQRALSDNEQGYGDRRVVISPEAADHLVDVAGGDARSLLNALELAVETTPANDNGVIAIDLAIAEESIQQRAVLYDKQGDAHFDTISAFIKSLRGGDADAALFWLARMVEAGENPRFIFRRMLIAAGEDIGLADPQAIVVVEACAAAFERIGLPEGLYPLAQAALYLANTEKSNSVLGFFDALKAVRQSSKQQVPAHLRDANRDGQAFGDGVGYRYPHAYAEHWVAQQYLPSGLQGQLFWQPGSQGFEGQLRQRLQQRRAAQLAAAAETAAEQSDILSFSPAEPDLQRWLARAAVAEGERLDQLRQRLWRDTHWQRHERVLILGGRSLLWALDALEHTPEGQVVICAASVDDQQRLQAQLQVLDALRQPEVVVGLDTVEGVFEHIAGRQISLPQSPEQRQQLLQRLAERAAPGAELRLLQSEPLLGPVGGLLEWWAGQAKQAAANRRAALEPLAAAETRWLQDGSSDWADLLSGSDWQPQGSDSWEEGLQLVLHKDLLQRWFNPAQPYGQLLAKHLAEARQQAWLQQQFQAALGAALPQRVRHTLLLARWPVTAALSAPPR